MPSATNVWPPRSPAKAAVKAGDVLSPGEMRALYVALADTRLPAHDVHGRSTIVRLSWDELDQRFGKMTDVDGASLITPVIIGPTAAGSRPSPCIWHQTLRVVDHQCRLATGVRRFQHRDGKPSADERD
ncbi:MAG: hypothetical protein IPP90_16595 [Gemmatimonadaceae bacterium]|nr:hypothetical protein [Gemmatimonadaceae bacterium]